MTGPWVATEDRHPTEVRGVGQSAVHSQWRPPWLQHRIRPEGLMSSCHLLQVHTRPGSKLEHESTQLQSQMLVISLLSLFPSLFNHK